MKTSHEHEHFDFEAATDSPEALVGYEYLETEQGIVDTRGLEEVLAEMATAKAVKTDFDLAA